MDIRTPPQRATELAPEALPVRDRQQFGPRITPSLTGGNKHFAPIQALLEPFQHGKGVEGAINHLATIQHEPPPAGTNRSRWGMMELRRLHPIKVAEKLQGIKGRLATEGALKLNRREHGRQETPDLRILAFELIVKGFMWRLDEILNLGNRRRNLVGGMVGKDARADVSIRNVGIQQELADGLQAERRRIEIIKRPQPGFFLLMGIGDKQGINDLVEDIEGIILRSRLQLDRKGP